MGAGSVTVTFFGKADYLDVVIPKNEIDTVIVDLSYVYVKDKPISNPYELVTALREKYGVTAITFESGLPYGVRSDSYFYPVGDPEMINRRIRIAKALSLVGAMPPQPLVGDTPSGGTTPPHGVIIFDSDVFVNDVSALQKIRHMLSQGISFSICIPAVIKPFRYIDIFCKSTNMALTQRDVERLNDILNDYIRSGLYVVKPVDVYIAEKLGLQQLLIDNVCHYINGVPYCVNHSAYGVSITVHG